MGIAIQLEKLSKLRDDLENTLISKGQEVLPGASLSIMIPMVENITGTHSYPEINRPLYSIGVLSDVHIKDDNYVGSDQGGTNSLQKYINALTFYKNMGVDMVCIAGDIVANNRLLTDDKQDSINEWLSELQMFKQKSEQIFPQKVFTTSGNHDSNIYGHYAENNNLQGMEQIVTGYGDGNQKAEQVWKEIIGTDLNFVLQKENDVYIFFGEYYWNYTNFCRKEDILWLQSKLELYKNNRVFLFAHLLAPDTFGLGSGLISGGYPDDYPFENKNTATQFCELIGRYKNIIWFSGHSHVDLNYETETIGGILYPNANIYQNANSPVYVHVPSSAYLRKYPNSVDQYENDVNGSQGLLVDVFTDRIVIKGVDFVSDDRCVRKVNYTVYTLHVE